MTDGNTYAINKHLDDALLKITAEIEQAETHRTYRGTGR